MGVWNAQVMETACKLPGTETGGNGNGMYATPGWKACVRKPQVKMRSAVNSGVGAYNLHVKHRKYETHLKRCTDKLCQGGYPSSLDFSVCCLSLY